MKAVCAGLSARRTLRKYHSRRRPKCELASRGVPDCSHALEIQGSVQTRKRVDPGGDVFECLGPAATGPDAPIFQVPRGSEP